MSAAAAPHPDVASRVAAVVIGRDEGETLTSSLARCGEQCAAVVYVDSGSSDDSVAGALRLGASVVEIGSIVPFLPGIARNAGFSRLEELAPDVEFVHFVDGDCVLEPEWIAAAVAALDADPNLHVVCGQLLEVDFAASPWKRMCQIEWAEDPGQVEWCGGIFMVRARVFRDLAGFREDMVAGEEPELCTRIRSAGGGIQRLGVPMASHESHMLHFSQWWQRELRGGYMDFWGATPEGDRPFLREGFQTYAWTLGWLSLCIGLAFVAGVPGLAIGASILPLQMLRQARWCRRQGHDAVSSRVYGVLVVLCTWPKLLGQACFYWDRRSMMHGQALREQG